MNIDYPNLELNYNKKSGYGLFTKKSYNKGEVVYSVNTKNIISEVYNKELFGKKCDENLLKHSIPGINGYIYTFSKNVPIYYENHSNNPNISSIKWDIIIRKRNFDSVIDKIALKNIKKDEEILVDYNEAVGYDLRTDNTMQFFLQKCEEFNVIKRPSQFKVL